MFYTQLSQEYQDDTLAEALYAREVEHFHYEFDRANFETMLLQLEEGDPYRIELTTRLAATEAALRVVEVVYAALTARIGDPVAHAAAVERAKTKRQKAVFDA